MKKIILSLLFLFFFSVPPVFAVDRTITCNATSCSDSGGTNPLFESSTVWYPGLTLSKTVQVKNTDTNPLTITTKNDEKNTNKKMDTIIQITITRTSDGNIRFTGNVRDLYNAGWIDLTSPYLEGNKSEEYSYAVSMDPNAGNEYQGASTTFDLSFHFSGGTPDENKNQSNTGGTSTTSTGGTTTTANPTATPIQQQASIIAETPTPISEVQGQTTEQQPEEGQVGGITICKTCVWWPFLVLELVLLLLFYRVILLSLPYRKQKLMTLSVPIATYWLFLWWNKPCLTGIILRSDSFICQYFLLIASAIYAILSIFCCTKNNKRN